MAFFCLLYKAVNMQDDGFNDKSLAASYYVQMFLQMV
jgi:hypothetical protein